MAPPTCGKSTKPLTGIYREDDARTVNGVILEALEEIPVAGTRVRIGESTIDILDVQDNMIKQVKVFPVKPLRESVAE